MSVAEMMDKWKYKGKHDSKWGIYFKNRGGPYLMKDKRKLLEIVWLYSEESD